MADIFISYATEDRAHAGTLAAVLATRGWTIWWDREIDAGADFEQVIEARINDARCVLVLWSPRSVKSHWVKGEARVGLDRGVLIPVLLEAVQQPLDFRATQAADLSTWDGTIDSEPFQRLCRAISRLAGDPQTGVTPPNVHPQPSPRHVPAAGDGRAETIGIGAHWLARYRPLFAGMFCGGALGIALSLFYASEVGNGEAAPLAAGLAVAGAIAGHITAGKKARVVSAVIGAGAAILGLGMVSAEPTAIAAWIYGSAVGSILGATVALLIERVMAFLSSRGTA